MMTGYHPRRNLSRTSHAPCPKRFTIWYDFIYHLRSILFSRIFLSLLPRQPCSYSRTRWLLTTHWNHHPRSIRSAPFKHRSSPCIRCNSNLGTSQHYGRSSKTDNPVSNANYSSRLLLHLPTSHRVLRGPFHNRRWSIWFYIFCGNRLPRTPCYHWLNISSCMPTSSNSLPLYIRPPLWI